MVLCHSLFICILGAQVDIDLLKKQHETGETHWCEYPQQRTAEPGVWTGAVLLMTLLRAGPVGWTYNG